MKSHSSEAKDDEDLLLLLEVEELALDKFEVEAMEGESEMERSSADSSEGGGE